METLFGCLKTKNKFSWEKMSAVPTSGHWSFSGGVEEMRGTEKFVPKWSDLRPGIFLPRWMTGVPPTSANPGLVGILIFCPAHRLPTLIIRMQTELRWWKRRHLMTMVRPQVDTKCAMVLTFALTFKFQNFALMTQCVIIIWEVHASRLHFHFSWGCPSCSDWQGVPSFFEPEADFFQKSLT